MCSNNAFKQHCAALVMSSKENKYPCYLAEKVTLHFVLVLKTKGSCFLLLPTQCCLMIPALPAVRAELTRVSYTNTLRQLYQFPIV